MNNWRRNFAALLALLAVILVFAVTAPQIAAGAGHGDHRHNDPLLRTSKAIDFREDMRKLWKITSPGRAW